MVVSNPDSSPPLRALRVFCVLAAAERHRDAAAQLGVTTSAISQQVRLLEAWFGTPLFERDVRTPVLTPSGRTLRDAIDPPLAQIDVACRAIRRASRETKIIVSAPPAFLSFRLIPHLSTFWTERPEIEIDIRLATQFGAPVNLSEVDLGIRFLNEPGPNRVIGRSGWSAFCRPDYFEKLQRPSSVGDLTSATLLHESIFNFWPQEFALAGLDIPPRVLFRAVGDASMVLSAVLAGNAVALLPAELSWQFVRDGSLVSPFRARIERDASYVAIYDRTRQNHAIEKLISHMSA